MKFFEKAYELAKLAHKNQFRKDGKPYITHIDGVIQNTKELWFNSTNTTVQLVKSSIISYREASPEKMLDGILALAALHDSWEDNPNLINTNYLAQNLFKLAPNEAFYNVFLSGLMAITKKPKGQEEYINYVLKVKYHSWARIVKIADLEHNMSDLQPGNLRDKYSLTKYFLEN